LELSTFIKDNDDDDDDGKYPPCPRLAPMRKYADLYTQKVEKTRT